MKVQRCSGQRHAPVALSLGQTPGTHCTRGRVALRAGPDGCEKSRRHRDIFYIHIHCLITVTFQFTPCLTFQESGGLAAIRTVCHTLTILPPLNITHLTALEMFVTVALRSGRCYMLLLCTLCSIVIAILLVPGDKDVIISLTYPGLCRRVGGGGASALPIVSPNSCLLFPTSSPDSSSTALSVESRYIPLATSFYGYALCSTRGSPGSTVSPDVVVVV